MAARQWTLEQRKLQSELIKQWQPWKHSTGAKTPEGKVMSSQNAYKHGVSGLLKEMRQLLRKQKQLIEEVFKG